MIKRKNVGIIGTRGGKQENLYLCLLEYFYEEDRWFLSGLQQIKNIDTVDMEEPSTNSTASISKTQITSKNKNNSTSSSSEDEKILKWIHDNNIQKLIVDFPLTNPPCALECLAECSQPKESRTCPRPEVQLIQEKIKSILDQDQKLIQANPKLYEHNRIEKNKNENVPQLLSYSFKRRLKKGFIPYWNRPIDVWIWMEYFDILLKNFKFTYDSFGQSSIMHYFRFNFLRRQFPPQLELYETSIPLILIELMNSKILNTEADFVAEKVINNLSSVEDRLRLIHEIEKKFKIFIYGHDIEILVKNPRAFHTFLLALAGQRLLLNELKPIPNWCSQHTQHHQLTGQFLIPKF